MIPRPGAAPASEASWTFLTNHAHVLLCLAMDSQARIREIADKVGITERAVQKIVADLEEGGYLTRARAGRRNRYQIHAHQPLRHPIESHRNIEALLALVLSPDAASAEHARPVRPRASSHPPR
ncbi:helix-turn-helix transcriptional regulator [Hyalangium versicolor]|uniref:helix-turn-helix transcriptional regulator n=1 Tax=Hyalangium versicolor TaxID=2861190 RepID=UPI001CCBE8EE|nr:winged helix-turn-helix domain-containing protein [Hyalangium versicolor]